MAVKTESWPGKQNHGWKNRIMAGKTESWLGKQNHGWENRTMAGKTESWLGKQNRGWENRTMAGKKAAVPVSRDCRQWTTALRADERLAVHPIGVTTHLAERA